MKLTDLFWQLKTDIQEIESELERAIDTDEPVLREASVHLLRAGGKRIRPLFVLLGGEFGNYDLSRLKKVAVPLELIHMATLVHDDVIDDADMRRGKETVKAKWDNKIAMYTGDFLFAKALTTIAELGDPRIHQALSAAIVEMCKGEIEQIRDFYNWNQSLRHYLRRIKRKTALLIAVSCKLGALAAGAKEDVVKSLYQFGYDVGMAFQITDDILDFIGTEKKLGKPAGSDLRQGNITLPVLYTLRCSPIRDRFLSWLNRRDREGYIEQAVQLVKAGGGIEYSKKLADQYLQRARSWIESFPSSRSKKSLLEITYFIGERQF
ncbi:heptaprenyl diphosphate synthase component II [Bacillaceae bacterium]